MEETSFGNANSQSSSCDIAFSLFLPLQKGHAENLPLCLLQEGRFMDQDRLGAQSKLAPGLTRHRLSVPKD